MKYLLVALVMAEITNHEVKYREVQACRLSLSVCLADALSL